MVKTLGVRWAYTLVSAPRRGATGAGCAGRPEPCV